MALGQDRLNGRSRFCRLLKLRQAFETNADGFLDYSIARRGFQEALIACAKAVKTPAFDRRSGLDFDAARSSILLLSSDAIGGSCAWCRVLSIFCGGVMNNLEEQLRVGSKNQ